MDLFREGTNLSSKSNVDFGLKCEFWQEREINEFLWNWQQILDLTRPDSTQRLISGTEFT